MLLTSGVFNWCWPIFRTNYTSIDKVLDDCVLRSYRLITLVNTYRSQNSDSERLVFALSDYDPSQDRADLYSCFLPSEMLIRLSVFFKMIKIGVKVLISKLRYYASKGWYQRQLLRILYILILLPSDGCNIALGSKQISIFMTNCLIELFKSSVTNSSILFQNTPNEYINQVPLRSLRHWGV